MDSSLLPLASLGRILYIRGINVNENLQFQCIFFSQNGTFHVQRKKKKAGIANKPRLAKHMNFIFLVLVAYPVEPEFPYPRLVLFLLSREAVRL